MLKPLLHDPLPTIQQVAANTIGKLASYSESVSQQIVSVDILSTLINSHGMEHVTYIIYCQQL